MLARGIHSGKVERAVLTAVAESGVEVYYERMPHEDKIWFHKRRAALAKRNKQRDVAVHHYDKLQALQGWRWKVAVKRWLVRRGVV